VRGLVIAALLASCSANDDVPSPQIASVTPDQAPPGQIVTIAGSYFCQRPRGITEDPDCSVAGTVHFGTVPGTPSVWQDTALMVEVPAAAAGRADVQVITGGRSSNTVAFTVN
jgi:hypothetical protein